MITDKQPSSSDRTAEKRKETFEKSVWDLNIAARPKQLSGAKQRLLSRVPMDPDAILLMKLPALDPEWLGKC